MLPGSRASMWIIRAMQWLFRGDQLKTLLGMIGVFTLIIVTGALRAKARQDHG